MPTKPAGSRALPVRTTSCRCCGKAVPGRGRRGDLPAIRPSFSWPTYGILANAHGSLSFLRQVMPPFLACVPPERLIIVGSGAGRELRELGERLGRAVSFLDYV